MDSGDCWGVSNLVKSAHSSTLDHHQSLSVLGYHAARRQQVPDRSELPCETLYPQHFELWVSPCPCTLGRQHGERLVCSHLLWSRGGESMLLVSQSHLRAVIVVAISVKRDWVLPFRLKEGNGTHQILCLFYISFQP